MYPSGLLRNREIQGWGSGSGEELIKVTPVS